MYVILFKSIIIGFVTTVPVGPIGLLCISRALSGGAAYGVVSWLGVAMANALAGGIVALGLTLIPGLPTSLQPWSSIDRWSVALLSGGEDFHG